MPTTRSTTSTARLALAVLAPLILLLAACSSASSGGDDFSDVGVIPEASAGAAGDGAEQPARDLAGEGGGAGGGPVPSAPPGLAAPIEQRIVKTGEISLEVDSVAESLGRVRAMVAELGGYVGGSQAGTLEQSATLTVRIPAESFDAALARLHELDAKVVAESTREEDVTTQVVDLGARIDNLEASEASYRELVARAEDVDDILAVQSRLDQVRGEIEQLTAQLDALEGRASLSTLTITLVPRAEPVQAKAEGWDPGGQLEQALASLVGIGQGLLTGLIWFGIVWLPMLLVLAIIAFLALRGFLEVRRRMPGHPGAG